MRWGKASPSDLVMKEAPRGIKFALGENPKRANFNAPGHAPLPGYAHGRGGPDPQGLRGREGLPARVGGVRAEGARRPGPKGEKPVPPRTDLRLEALVDILDGKVLVHAHCYRSDEILMLIKVAEDEGFKIRTFQHVLEGYKVAREIAKHGAGASTFSDWWAYKMEAHDAIPYNAAVMASKGVIVSLNSDSDELARRLYWEAAKTMKYGGVTEDEALKMITANPAWQLGIDKQVGTLEVGKDADIAIFSAHPFSPDARVEMTLVEGAVMFDRERDVAARHGSPGGRWPSEARAGRAARRGRDSGRAHGLRAQEKALVIKDARIVRVDGPTIEKGTVVVAGGRIAAVDADVVGAAGRDRDRGGAGSTLYPGLIDGLTTLGLTEIGSVRRLGRHHRGRGREPARQGLGGGAPAQRADPGRAGQRRHHGAGRAGGRPRLGPERAHPPGRRHARGAGREGPGRDARRLPDRPSAVRLRAHLRRAGAEDASRSGRRTRSKNQEKDLQRLANLLEEAKAYAAGVAAAKGSGPGSTPDAALEALAPVARGEVPLVFRADDEEDIRGAVKFASERRLSW